MTSLCNDTNIHARPKLEQHIVWNSTFVQSVYWHRILEELTDSFRVKSPEIVHRVYQLLVTDVSKELGFFQNASYCLPLLSGTSRCGADIQSFGE